jgi:hypothetical protein
MYTGIRPVSKTHGIRVRRSQHPLKSTAEPFLVRHRNFCRWYTKFRKDYCKEPPKDEHRFVQDFLETQTFRVATVLQRTIYDNIPKVDSQEQPTGPHGRNQIYLYLDVQTVMWKDVCTALDSLNMDDMDRAQEADSRRKRMKRGRRNSCSSNGSQHHTKRRDQNSFSPDELHGPKLQHEKLYLSRQNNKQVKHGTRCLDNTHKAQGQTILITGHDQWTGQGSSEF